MATPTVVATVGTVAPFDSQLQSWEEYCEMLTFFFVANGIDGADRKKAILLSGVGATTYSLMRSLLSPQKPGDKSFDELVALLTAHFNPRPSEIVQRFRFNSRMRKAGETVTVYVAELRKLAQDCNYGDTLKQMLRDRLVCGVADDRIQRRLLAETGLTFDKALELAQAMETANKDVKDLQGHLEGEQGAAGRMSGGQVVVHQMASSDPRDRQKELNCYRCLGRHLAVDCRFANEQCHKCGKRGHIKRACRSAGKQQGSQRGKGSKARSGNISRAHLLEEGEEERKDSDGSEECLAIYTIGQKSPPKVAPITQIVKVNGAEVAFEVDTGCGVTIMNKEQYSKLCEGTVTAGLERCSVVLKTYSGEKLSVLGTTRVTVQYKDQTKSLPVIVVEGKGPNLMGRGWLKELSVNIQLVNKVMSAPERTLGDVLEQQSEVFKEGLGQLKGVMAKIHVPRDAQPRFYKPRPVPYAMKPLVERELERLQEDKIIEPVRYSQWACPIVPVMKGDGTVRICGDYKLTVNRVSSLEQYPLPKIEDLFANLAGGEKYSKLDMSHAYQQIVLDPESRECVTVNTHKGLFAYTRLPFGVSSSPAIFQRTIEGILQGIPHVTVYLDDILVSGRNEAEHLQNLAEVLRRLNDSGLRLKRSKCSFLADEVVFLGHRIDSAGLHPVAEKVQAIQEAPTPSNVTELKAYLGLLNYYHRFLPNLSTRLAPLHRLLKKEVKWRWDTEQQRAFDDSKSLMQSGALLVHYEGDKDLILACDASPYGVGAVLSHRMPDGTDRPIGFVSRTLTAAEKNYSQLDKEGLAVIFGVKKFHKYIYGRRFTIVTDHKPLLGLFSEMRAVPQMASPRIQRWAVTLGAYDYVVIYKPGKAHSNADALSRLPVQGEEEQEQEVERVLLLDQLDTPLVTAKQVKAWTDRDPVLSRVREYILRGWPEGVNDTPFIPYSHRQEELSTQAGCVLWGARVVIPPPGRAAILKQLHQSHPGITRMKGLARSYMWWPKLEAEIEALVNTCQVCQENRNLPAVAPLHPWEWPSKPWQRVHVDYAGPFLGKMFLILIDAHSKWMEVYPLNSSTTAVTIQCLRRTFSQLGLPEMVVSDNGTCFTSMEFKEFMDRNGITHVTSAPFHASSNGLAERAVQTFKRLMKKSSGEDIKTRVARALFSYRITPQSTTGKSPAELLYGRKLRSTLDLIHPDFRSQVEHKQLKQKQHHDLHAKERSVLVGDPVYTRNFSGGPTWVPGAVEERTGPVSCTVSLGNGKIVRRHIDQVRHRHMVSTPTPGEGLLTDSLSVESPQRGGWENPPLREGPDTHGPGVPNGLQQEGVSTPVEAVPVEQPLLRRSERSRRPPGYLKDFS